MIYTFKTILSRKEQLTEDVYFLEFKLPDQTIDFKAGQYLILLCPQENGISLRRLYSIASHPNSKDRFYLIAEIIPDGVASQYFLRMNVGDEVQFQGPAGMFVLKDDNHRIFLATGTGIAPMFSMLNDIIRGNAHSDHMNHLFWGVQYLKDVYLLNELKAFTKEHPSFDFMICLSKEQSLAAIPQEDQKYFMLGRVNNGLESKLGVISHNQDVTIPLHSDYYICGGRTVVESLRQYLYTKNVPKDRVVFEKF